AVVRIEPGLKFPRIDGWQLPGGYITSADDAEAFYTTHPDWNIGVVLGASRLCSLDIDNAPEAKQILAEFGVDIDHYSKVYPTIMGNPARFRVEFALPDGVELPTHKLRWPNQDDPGKYHVVLELRSGNVQDVFPPSIHPDTKRPYEWVTRPNGKFPTIPDELLAIWRNWEQFSEEATALCPWGTHRIKAPQFVERPRVEGDGESVIEAFNKAHDIGAILEQYGYKPMGKRWLSPHSSTGLPGVTRLDEQRVFVHHGSDPLCADPPHPISAFDVYKEYEHHGNVKEAVKAAARLLGLDHRSIAHLPSEKRRERRDTTQTEIDAAVTALSMLSELDYEAQRSAVSEKLHIRLAALDKMVNDARGQLMEPEDTGQDVKQLPNYALWTSLGLDLTKNGPLCNLNNAVKCILGAQSLAGRIWYDEFSKRIYTDLFGGVHEWSDYDTVQLTLSIQRELGLAKMTTMQVREALVFASRQSTRNAPKEYFESLVWDQQERLPTVMMFGWGTPQDEYYEAVGKCWFISMIARVMRPGCQVDTVPVFEGEQGAFKSTALSIIGGDWYTECHEQAVSKDFFMILEGKLVVEIAEMHAFSKAEVLRVKGIISCRVDRYRAPYAATVENHPRQSVLACTTNEDQWNRDPTGARRFWPIRCGKIDLNYLASNRDQLFAEAFHRYK
ncbi:MAG: bifunctional DNA primase/polymerase, partial [Bradyrhizobium sp.]|nr:bifunctional DNA primase/polymerase [Bradyrhizobium sp.]